MNAIAVFVAGRALVAAAVLSSTLLAAAAHGAEGSLDAQAAGAHEAALAARDGGLAISVQAQPRSLLLKEGDPALFRTTGVRADGAAAVRYQWRRNSTDIAGAQKPWLKLDRVSLADDGSRYTVVVSVGSATTESRPCALRVVSASTVLGPDD